MDIVFNQHPNGTFDIEYFQYTPSKEAGLAFMALFAAAGVAHIGYMFFFRAWSFIPMILGGICKLTLLLPFLPPPYQHLPNAPAYNWTNQESHLQVKYSATTADSWPIPNRTTSAPG